MGTSGIDSEVLASVHIVTLPSYREGLPKVLLEAAASGRPIVTTDVPGCREVVQDGVNGLLVPAREIDPLVRAIRILINDAPRRAELGRQGRFLMEREFSVEEVVRRTMPLYRHGP